MTALTGQALDEARALAQAAVRDLRARKPRLDDDAIDANLADVVPSKRLRSLAARRDEILAQKAASDRR